MMERALTKSMPPLERVLRNKLEHTVTEARIVAESAARAAIEQLGVGESKTYQHLSDQEKELRRKLRIHGRQLGDIRNARTEVQEIDLLIEETAYEHWHRMLFARFLTENDLLMCPDPDDPVAVTLEECEELAAGENAANGWELAARFASRMLPQIFRPDSPVFQLVLPPEHQQKLEHLVTELPQEVFTASDSLGWVYQFWQARKKDEINASEVKIGSREISAVTQLFTEPYMVSFLLDNSIGAWWAGRRLSEEDKASASTEEELRAKTALPGMPLEYLRFVKGENGKWVPAAGTFDNWPKSLAEIKVLDPCCGSGHFLIAAFLMLVAIRMELEGLSIQDAVNAVFRDNIYGLEIDRRCTEIAAFNLALTAWRLTGYRSLPPPHIACTGLSVGGTRDQWMGIVDGQGINVNLRFFFGQLYDLFSKAPTLGSLINPYRFLGSGLLDIKGMDSLQSALTAIMAGESKVVTERHEMGIAAQGIAKAAELLADRYTLVMTNVPYLGRGKQADVLKEYLETCYPLGKADLATAFLLRCLEFCTKGGTTAIVTPQNWLFLTTYTKLRQMLLENRMWNMLARLGPGAFETISGHVVNVALSIFSATEPNESFMMAGIDVSGAKMPEEKAARLRGDMNGRIVMLAQNKQIANANSTIILEDLLKIDQLDQYASSHFGLHVGDWEAYRRNVWEIPEMGEDWRNLHNAISTTALYSGLDDVIFWPNDGKMHRNNPAARVQGRPAWGKSGIAISMMGHLPGSIYQGGLFRNGVAAIVPFDPGLLAAIWTFCSSPEFNTEVRKIDQKLYVTAGNLVKVPFDLAHWQKVAAEKYPDGLPEPESDDPTQWLFHGRPEQSTAPLQVAVARLLGYRWPAELDRDMRLSQRARDLVNQCNELLPFVDGDGIVCIPPVRGESPAADRLLDLLAKAYGKNWNTDVLGKLLKDAGFAGKSLENWLRDGFFTQHCELFHQRPFIWHIWDGLRDGFSALVNYHMLDRKNMETLIYTYIGDWIRRQKDSIASAVDGAQERLAAALNLKKRLELILEGEAPYDIFVRWKPLQEQSIGWEPDLNDGVRINIRPFLLAGDVKVKDAEVLRMKPRIKWDKDRGKEPYRQKHEYPWFWGWNGTTDFAGGLEFTGDRFNDCHYNIDFKLQARMRVSDKEGESS